MIAAMISDCRISGKNAPVPRWVVSAQESEQVVNAAGVSPCAFSIVIISIIEVVLLTGET
jgi:hypothetical protein